MLSGFAVWTLGRKACFGIGLMVTDNDYSISLLGYNQWSEARSWKNKIDGKKEENRAKKKKEIK